jgi:transposase
MFYIGIDWADDHHDIFIVDELGTQLDSFSIKHNPEGMCYLRDKIRSLSVSKDQVLFALETHKNLLVDFLLDEGYTVYSINPKSVDRYRDRYRVSGARDDSFDAMVLANIIRTDKEQHRAILPNSPLARELKILTQDEQKLIRLKTKLLNQIQSCLKDYYPTALELFCDLERPVTLEFLLKYSQPEKISVVELKRFLKKHHYPGVDEKAKEIHEKLSAPQIFVEEFAVRAKSRFLVTLIEQLKSLLSRLDEYRKEIDILFEQHPDSKIFKSLPGAGEKTAPRLLSEIGDNRERYPDRKNLQCDSGTAPVTDKSGKTKIVKMRFACRKVFRNVIYQFAFSTITQSAWAKKFYDCQRAKGNTHTEALRSLGNKWLKIIFRMWKDGAAYNEDRHFADIMRFQLNAASVA